MTGVTGADEGAIALACMSIFVEELTRSGVRDVCISPGSRSTPLTLAFARTPGMRRHVHLDERSSAYFALGRALVDGVPVAVVCTSGTAVANWHPAVVEASMAGVPLLLLSADRPPGLRDTGANQTIDQLRIFGGAVRWFVEAAVPEARPDAGRYWRSLAARAATAARGGNPGPVHVNLPFREPLVPGGGTVDLGPDAGGRADGAPWELVSNSPSAAAEQDVIALTTEIEATERGLVTAGTLPAGGDAVGRLAMAACWPLLAEPVSGLRSGPPALTAGQLLAGDARFREAHRPDTVLHVGAAPTGRAVQELIATAGRLIVVGAAGHHRDPARQAAWSLCTDPAQLATAVASCLAGRHSTGWSKSWTQADAAVCRQVAAQLAGFGDELFDGAVAREVAAALPSGATLLVGSSMPIRDLDAFMLPRPDVRIVANRGASGIDGTVSTALGMAAGTRTYALVGDLTLLHDAGALLWSCHDRHDLVIIVINNDGGGIFSLLPAAGLPEHEEFYATPHGLNLEALARAAGTGHRAVAGIVELLPAIREGEAAGGVQLIEVRTDRRRNAEQQALVRRAAGDALLAMTVHREY